MATCGSLIFRLGTLSNSTFQPGSSASMPFPRPIANPGASLLARMATYGLLKTAATTSGVSTRKPLRLPSSLFRRPTAFLPKLRLARMATSGSSSLVWWQYREDHDGVETSLIAESCSNTENRNWNDGHPRGASIEIWERLTPARGPGPTCHDPNHRADPYSSVKLEGASWPVILSGAKNPSSHRKILRSTQNDSQHGAMKVDRVLLCDDATNHPS